MSASEKILATLSVAWDDRDQAKRDLHAAEQKVREATEKALAATCPTALRSNNFIPLTPTTGVVVHRFEMAPPLVADGLPHWVARGHKVRFRVGNEESVGPCIVEQPAYEALPEEVRALTRQEMLKASREQKLTGMDAPLKLTDRQRQMFSLLSNNNERLAFSGEPVEGGQRLPAAIWDSGSSTQAIWTAMVKRGVLVITAGALSDPYAQWRVNPGPRFADAVALVAKHLHEKYPNTPGTEQFFRSFNVAAPSSPGRSGPR